MGLAAKTWSSAAVAMLGCIGQVVSARALRGRRLVLTIGSRFANRRFVFAFVCLAVFASKLVHIGAHLSALTGSSLRLWGLSFFAQDMILLLLLRFLFEFWNIPGRFEFSLRFIASVLWASIIASISVICIIHTTFFVVSGNEIHWRNVGIAGDAAGRALLLSGLTSCILVVGVLCFGAWVLQDILFIAAGVVADILSLPLVYATSGRLRRIRTQWNRSSYVEIPQDDVEMGEKMEYFEDTETLCREPESPTANAKELPRAGTWRLVFYTAATGLILTQIILCSVRPTDRALSYMSWTPILLPFVELRTPSGGSRVDLGLLSDDDDSTSWTSVSALTDTIPLPWLPSEPVTGFEDWYQNATHYNAAVDPLKISNLDQDLLAGLAGQLRNVTIRNVMFIVLESTRKDVFPVKKESLVMDRLTESWGAQGMPDEALERLKSLTPTAKLITGDFEDGFQEKTGGQRPRGGINFNDAYTTSTYTLKSLTGLLCGVSPLVADFNLEHRHHIYQPCLPHILDALNTLDHGTADNYTAHKWRSAFMQSATLNFDDFGSLMKRIGFPSDSLVDKEYLIGKDAKFGPVTLPDVNYFGFEETPLEDYFRDIFSSARKANERVFLTHVTSTSHHPWTMPGNEAPVELGKGMEDLSNYLNTIGWDDRWLSNVLKILEEEGVADETLLIFAGDHGLPMVENGGVATYYDPNVGGNHVPLVLSHPKLPPITIDDSVSSLQVLPTILDLLVETGSLSPSASQAARDLAHNYEGQSLIRPVLKSADVKSSGSEGTPARTIGNWHFTVINPGRAMIGVRDARHKTWRLVVPTRDDTEWRFSDLEKDPRESHPLSTFGFLGLVARVREEFGKEAAEWVTEAAQVTRWWAEENSKRWRYAHSAA
ncbi:hypothetical protein HIM_06583 [Hirsutella minnesotensis 3608]|uniref:Sulfatase N-terminal domain-containing protein n=1 Tax=Hirsutella minnesotensis 3608 TaxID=1043627 RepID=A0A0F7ZNK6_9HYPO|nr:hypothetical protein HIM_06583 [Hirsutella minnesotensis 3608]